MNDLGLVSHWLDERDAAERFCEQSRIMFRKIGDRRGNAFATFNLGMIAARDGHHERARRLYSESLALRQDSHDRWGTAISLVHLGAESRELGNLEEAKTLLLRALRIAWESSIPPAVLDALLGLATLALENGDTAGAMAILAAVEAHPASHGQLQDDLAAIIERHSLPIDPVSQPDRWAIGAVDDVVRSLLA
jgi:tetratricopeptide (TPR) repeat protein